MATTTGLNLRQENAKRILTLDDLFKTNGPTFHFSKQRQSVAPVTDTTNFLYLDRDSLHRTEFGLDDLMLYVRPNVRGQLKCIEDQVLDQNLIGTIQGPPGQGKSIITYYASLLACQQGWRVLWIWAKEFDHRLKLVVFTLEGNKKFIHSSLSISDIENFVNNTKDVDVKTLIVLDWFNREELELQTLADRIDTWVCRTQNLRLIKLKRLFGPRRPEREHVWNMSYVYYSVDQWNLKDEMIAVGLENDAFYVHIREYMDPGVFEPQEQLESKARLTGARPGLFFHTKPNDVSEYFRGAAVWWAGIDYSLSESRTYILLNSHDNYEHRCVSPLVEKYLEREFNYAWG